jgi:hypothetical protein
MTSIDGRLNLSGLRPLDMSKLKPIKISEAPEELYQRLISAQESFLESRYSQAPDTSGNPAYQPYAVVKVNGKVVAEIDNHGFTETSNALGGIIREALADADRRAGVKQGPRLAQARAEKIAELLGGKVEKAATALTQSRFETIPQPRATVDRAAMEKDPLYERLQQTKAARTLFLAQQLAG